MMIRKKRSTVQEALWGYLMIAPVILGLLIFDYIAMGGALAISFTKWNILSPAQWVGLNNYIYLFQNEVFQKTIWNTVRYTIINVPITLVIALILALALNTKIRFRSFYRLVYFLPVLTMPVAVSYVWKWVYNFQYGILNVILSDFGLARVNWLGDIHVATLAIVAEAVWLAVGYQMIIFIAGLKNIPREYYEAARVDGANSWQRFWAITLPLLTPTVFFNMVTSLIGSLQVFEVVYVITQGGPMDSTRTVVYSLYQDGFVAFQMGRATAEGWVLFIMVLLLTIIQFRMQRRWVQYG